MEIHESLDDFSVEGVTMRRYLLCLGLVMAGCAEEPLLPLDGGACLTGVFTDYAGWQVMNACGGTTVDNPFEKCQLSTPLCMPYELPRDDVGAVYCEVLEQLPDEGVHCADLADIGRDPEPVDVIDGREVCNVRQVVSPDGLDPGEPGYYYTQDPDRCLRTDGTAGRIVFSEGSGPLAGSRVRVDCLAYQAGDCD